MSRPLRMKVGAVVARHRRAALLVLLLAGLAGAIALVASRGVAAVAAAIAAAGWLGFAAVCGVRALSFLLRAIGWTFLIPAPLPGLFVCVSARALRESLGNLFALGPISGEFAAGRLLVLAGVDSRRATASLIVDLALEAVCQILFIVAGLIVAAVRLSAAQLAPWLVTAAVAVLAVAALPILARSRFALHILETMLARLARRSDVAVANDEVLAALVGRTFRRRLDLLLSGLFHLAAWPLAAVETWALCALAGWGLDFADAVIVEALVLAARTAFFFVPLSLGVQEGGYAVAGALVGLAAGPALAVSLLKRARDFAFGVPAILGWHALEWVALRGRPKVRASEPTDHPAR